MSRYVNDSCMWTAWGDVVCEKRKVNPHTGREHFIPSAVPTPTSCSIDTDCDARSRCDNLNANSSAWACKPCSDIGCVVGKACGCLVGDSSCSGSTGGSSDCAQGLSCQNNICTVGGLPTHLNNSDANVTSTDTDTVGQSYEIQRQKYMTQNATGDAGVRDCAMFGTCQQGFPCDGSSQCAVDLMCDGGVCKASFSGL